MSTKREPVQFVVDVRGKTQAVILPFVDYRTLLAEAGYRPTPRLDRAIAQARARFHKGCVTLWKQRSAHD